MQELSQIRYIIERAKYNKKNTTTNEGNVLLTARENYEAVGNVSTTHNPILSDLERNKFEITQKLR